MSRDTSSYVGLHCTKGTGVPFPEVSMALDGLDLLPAVPLKWKGNFMYTLNIDKNLVKCMYAAFPVVVVLIYFPIGNYVLCFSLLTNY
jgi:hypothetical protein